MSSSNSEQLVEVESSKLGTKEHWDECYDREINCFNDTGDVGEIWFGETCLKKMCKDIANIKDISKDAAILDIGCGNGYTLVELSQLGFTNLHGSDYSAKAIDLSKQIAESESIDINYFVDDIRNSIIKENSYDVVVDKGTFDAMALSEERDQAKFDYKTTVSKILKSGGYFIITSCNYTNAELQQYFTSNTDTTLHSNYTFSHNVQYPVFKFGGSQGQSQTTCSHNRIVFLSIPPKTLCRVVADITNIIYVDISYSDNPIHPHRFINVVS
ncbi:hypothetical protein PPL_06510 [Heterostelium album PN500]|uniref:Protein-lysine N-methyltransferase PPL_06510 n=1 Tax=Heterostelium pallidum (strain ATCC 26659 / Pp 5 / PN500) TaxID=670386 RepID=D3BDC7_HETP5|nr:hypothetical protein PPL_06510 [Heterostelium album PN500]EFA80571.1 hypothetical protein PPL_06510 [Heterostelium album PN500]|eukprot:XP_020432691.1 hypothetical protein PPL_06510 [Heterostelium album PN500]